MVGGARLPRCRAQRSGGGVLVLQRSSSPVARAATDIPARQGQHQQGGQEQRPGQAPGHLWRRSAQGGQGTPEGGRGPAGLPAGGVDDGAPTESRRGESQRRIPRRRAAPLQPPGGGEDAEHQGRELPPLPKGQMQQGSTSADSRTRAASGAPGGGSHSSTSGAGGCGTSPSGFRRAFRATRRA